MRRKPWVFGALDSHQCFRKARPAAPPAGLALPARTPLLLPLARVGGVRFVTSVVGRADGPEEGDVAPRVGCDAARPGRISARDPASQIGKTRPRPRELRSDAKARAFGACRCRRHCGLSHRELATVGGAAAAGPPHGRRRRRRRLLVKLGENLHREQHTTHHWLLSQSGGRARKNSAGKIRVLLGIPMCFVVAEPVWAGSSPVRAGGRREARRRRRRPPAEGRFSGLVVGIAGQRR
ncbi:hypothetical protein PVAP13_5KG705600 [Panicum virgatum]|uniref:Uncharacterized protein n=1 Tax=Panicum virgatum TaxID=38727 RepID=A0A8T0SSZ9_PANVG|nr:hypothetical protein PVAP13_5KG705600 [Panicum virgatum]